jgi:glyoxylase-like metal-dependent hydrolase (beta-lactamase superfamily II)
MGSNTVVIVGDSSVLLVDSQIAPSSARLLIQELGAVTALPVSHVVNTHWHLDHVGGNGVIRELYPRVQVLAHLGAPDGAELGGEDQRRRAAEFWREALGATPRQVDRLSLAELAEPYTFEPDALIGDRMRVDLGGRIVEVIATPSGHTGGDLVAYLPAERILAGGDLVLPQLFASRGFPGRYIHSLRALLDLDPLTVVPGHGPVRRGTILIAEQLTQLESLRSSVREATLRQEDETSTVARLAPSAGPALGDPEGLVRALLRETAGGSPARDIAIVGVNLIPMDEERLLRDHTVLVRGGRITAVGPRTELVIPDGLQRLTPPEGVDWYVMPGLADMHVHMFDEDEMWLYLANGVTTIRNLHGVERHLRWKSEIEVGERVGPRILTAGPILDGDPPSRSTNTVVRTPVEAREEVRREARLGYDFIKIYDNITPEVYEALADESRKAGLPMVGHLPTPVGFEGMLETGGQKAVEHCEELAPFFRDLAPGQLESMVHRMVDAGIWLGPTLVAWRWPIRQADPEIMAAIPWEYLNPSTLETFRWATETVSMSENERTIRQRGYDLCDEITRQFHLAGGQLLPGSDSPLPALPPGSTLLEELAAFEGIGLTPFEALATATTEAAEFAGQSEQFGMIEPGLWADLLILTANPLETTANLVEQAGVVVRGVWLSRQDLSQRLDELAAGYR